MGNFYDQYAQGGGVSRAGLLIQADGKIGGHRSVFVGLTGTKNGLVYPPIGGIIVNPFKGKAKAFAGDLCEYKIDGTVKILKTYQVGVAAGSTDTSVKIARDGYKHIPFVGDVLMKAPATITGTGTAVTVTAVSATTDNGNDVWVLTLSSTLGALAVGDILVEAAEAGSGKKMMVQNPNAFFDADNDFFFDPNADGDEYHKARYTYTPALANEDTKLVIAKMSPAPACVLALNKSLVEGWFNL